MYIAKHVKTQLKTLNLYPSRKRLRNGVLPG